MAPHGIGAIPVSPLPSGGHNASFRSPARNCEWDTPQQCAKTASNQDAFGLMPQRPLRSTQAGSRWGSGIYPNLAPQTSEAFGFSLYLQKKQSPRLVLAGLRTFLAERFGSMRQAFERMDFHQDGYISCLEFQEVVSSQERYCGLHDARYIFCLLARGTDGWLTWDSFHARLSSEQCSDIGNIIKDPVDEIGNGCESQALGPLVLSNTNSHPAGPALRALLQQQLPPAILGTPQLSTAMGLLETCGSSTPASSVASTRTPGQGVVCWSSDIEEEHIPHTKSTHASSLVPIFDGFGKHEHIEQKYYPFDATASLGSNTNFGFGGCNSSTSGVSACGQFAPQSPGMLTYRSSFVDLSMDPGKLFEGSGCNNAAVSELEEGLLSLRAEAAAVQALQANGFNTNTSTPLACPPINRATPPSGLSWILQLPPYIQGRLAACTGITEVLEVLDEVLDGLPTSSSPHPNSSLGGGVNIHTRTDCCEEAESSSRCCGFGNDSAVTGVQPEVVIASAELLRTLRERVEGLETELEVRQRHHEEQVAELRRRHREERRAALRKLLRKLAPPLGIHVASAGPLSQGSPGGTSTGAPWPPHKDKRATHDVRCRFYTGDDGVEMGPAAIAGHKGTWHSFKQHRAW